MDPEDLREVISAYQKCVADTVQRFGGFVAKYMGDGVLVYFGYPQAHEDDAQMCGAVRVSPGATAVDTQRTVLRKCHVDEWQRTTALNPPSHQLAYK